MHSVVHLVRRSPKHEPLDRVAGGRDQCDEQPRFDQRHRKANDDRNRKSREPHDSVPVAIVEGGSTARLQTFISLSSGLI